MYLFSVFQNLSQQSDVADLLGGFKPVDARFLCIPLYQEFENLFNKTFSSKVSLCHDKDSYLCFCFSSFVIITFLHFLCRTMKASLEA